MARPIHDVIGYTAAISAVVVGSVMIFLVVVSSEPEEVQEVITPPHLFECSQDVRDEVHLMLMDECARCRERESKNWVNAARRRIDQVGALEKRLAKCEEE